MQHSSNASERSSWVFYFLIILHGRLDEKIAWNQFESFFFYFKNQSKSGADLFEMVTLSILIFWSFVANFLFCEFGENVTSHFNELHNTLCQTEWNLYPIDIQRLLPIIMMSTRKEIILEGFGGVQLTRQAFETVSFNYLNLIQFLFYSLMRTKF